MHQVFLFFFCRFATEDMPSVTKSPHAEYARPPTNEEESCIHTKLQYSVVPTNRCHIDTPRCNPMSHHSSQDIQTKFITMSSAKAGQGAPVDRCNGRPKCKLSTTVSAGGINNMVASLLLASLFVVVVGLMLRAKCGYKNMQTESVLTSNNCHTIQKTKTSIDAPLSFNASLNSIKTSSSLLDLRHQVHQASLCFSGIAHGNVAGGVFVNY